MQRVDDPSLYAKPALRVQTGAGSWDNDGALAAGFLAVSASKAENTSHPVRVARRGLQPSKHAHPPDGNPMNREWNRARIAVAAMLLAFAAGCATAPPPPPREDLLTAAGFKSLVAGTELQRQHLASLPPGQLTGMQRTGRHYYVYPDVAGNRLYVGTPKEYQAYLALRTKNNLPNPPPEDSNAAFMQQYMKRDAAIEKDNAQAATIPSWAVWPEFGGLGWIP